MAKTGIDYFSLDVGFLRDKKIKLIKGEFGAKGILIVLQLLCSIYEGDGYYKSWDDDDCFLMADAVGCGITPELITQVVQGCVRRGFFDKDLFDMFGVLTSRSIQSRYCRAAYKRDIEIYKEYLLLDLNNSNDITEATSKKVTLKSLNSRNSIDNSRKDNSNSRNSKQSKVKESKVNKIKEREGTALPDSYFSNKELDDAFRLFLSYRISKYKEQLTTDQISLMIEELKTIADKDIDKIAILKKAIMKGWKNFYPLDKAKGNKSGTNKFNNFTQREYDFEDLEKQLLNSNGKVEDK